MGRHSSSPRSSKKRTLMIMGLCASLSLGGVSTIAGFTSNANSPVTVGSGGINLTAGGSTSFTLAYGSTMKPGQTISKTVALKNTGTIPLKYKITRSGTPGNLAKKLDAVLKAGTVELFSGKLSAITYGTFRTLNAGSTETLTLELKWVAGTAAADNALQNLSESLTLTFAGEQT